MAPPRHRPDLCRRDAVPGPWVEQERGWEQGRRQKGRQPTDLGIEALRDAREEFSRSSIRSILPPRAVNVCESSKMATASPSEKQASTPRRGWAPPGAPLGAETVLETAGDLAAADCCCPAFSTPRSETALLLGATSCASGPLLAALAREEDLRMALLEESYRSPRGGHFRYCP